MAPVGLQAATTKHRHHVAAAQGSATANAALLAEVKALREQVEALKSRVDMTTSDQQQTAAQVQSTQSKIDSVQAKVDATDTKVAAIPVAVTTAVDKATDKARHADKFYFKGLSITPGDFLELAAIYRQHNQANDISSSFNSIPFANNRAGYTNEGRLTARQSRLSFLAQGDVTKTIHLAMYGEFDFQGAAQTANSNESNSYNPRIRNLYGTLDYDGVDGGPGFHFLAGQNWSLVTMNSKGITPRNEVTPPQIDAQYVPGFAWARQPQVRVTGDFLDHKLWIAASAENPQTTFYTNGTPAGATAGTAGAAAPLPGSLVYNITGGSGFNSANTLSLNHIPDFVGKVAYEDTIGGHLVHVEAFGIYKSFYERIGGVNDDESGGGYGGSINVQIVPKILDAQFSGMKGKGIGRYGSSQLPDTTFDAGGVSRPISEYMLLAGATLHATKLLDIYGFAGEEIEDARAYTTAAGLAYGYGNPLYTNAGCLTEGSAVCNGNTHSIKQATVGFWQKVYVGPFGRAQVGAQYSYTERQAFAGVGGAPRAKQNMGFVSFRYYPF